MLLLALRKFTRQLCCQPNRGTQHTPVVHIMLSHNVSIDSRSAGSEFTMWPLSLFCLAALLQLGWDVQCCAHVVGDSSVHVRQEYTSGMLSDSTEMKAEAAYGALSYAGRKLKQSHHPPLASSTSIIKALAQVCPNVDTASAVFICQAAQTTLSSGQSVRALQQRLVISSFVDNNQPCATNRHSIAARKLKQQNSQKPTVAMLMRGLPCSWKLACRCLLIQPPCMPLK